MFRVKEVRNVASSASDETISRIVETYSPMLLRLSCTRLDDPADAEDVVQEVFLKLLIARPSFRDGEHEKAWLIRTTLHRASDLRRSATRRNVPLEEAALLAVSVSAVLFLTPADLAERLEDGPLTAEYNGKPVRDHTYAVFTVARTDGTPLTEQPELSYSPLVAGYHVSAVNGWNLCATCQSFVEDGMAYYPFDIRNLEMFADHTVYFAIYEGSVPSPAQFPAAEAGTISLAEGVTVAVFTLPLDEEKTDPAAAAFVKSTGLEFISGSGETTETEKDIVLSEK